MIELWFTTSRLPLSAIIRAATKSKSSHMAVCNKRDGLVYHFFFDGLRIETVQDFLGHATLVRAVTLPLEFKQRNVFVTMFNKHIDACKYGYDYGAFVWWAWQALLTCVTGRSVPGRNEGGQRYAFLCTELLYMVNAAFVEAAGWHLIPQGVALDTVSPDSVADIINREVTQHASKAS